MEANATWHPQKSTNVRIGNWAARVAIAGVQALDAASPELAARVAERLMFRTQRRRAAIWERAVLTTAERFSVQSASGRVQAWRWGAGPVVILAHGWNGRGSQLGAFVDPLLEAGFSVVAFDAPGHGASAGNESSLLHVADALDAIIDAVRPAFGRVHAVIAHSMGAPAAAYAMSRHARSPESALERVLRDNKLPVSRLVFIAPPIDVRDFIRVFAKRSGIGQQTVGALRRRVEERFGVPLEDLNALAVAPELAAPLLVVHDEQDTEVPLRCGQLLAEAWPGARLQVTRGLGHTRILRDPAVIAGIVDFVAKDEGDFAFADAPPTERTVIAA
jgi:pimeloyl-ACP methyl ester carboxylesterase